MYRYILSAFISLVFAAYFKSATIALLKDHNFTTKNYSGATIVNGGGLIFLYPCLLGILPFCNNIPDIDVLLYVSIIFSSLFMGLVDDFLGESHIKGFKGHIKMLFKGKTTTGILKIFIGIIIGFIASSIHYTKLWDIFFHTVLFALCINMMNLMDLRPGRAIKVFLIIAIAITLFAGVVDLWIFFPVVITVIIYIPGEMKERYMMGDTGSNLLGGILGLYIIRLPQTFIKLIIFCLLILIHILGEFYSLSKIIDMIPILKSIDNIGRLNKER